MNKDLDSVLGGQGIEALDSLSEKDQLRLLTMIDAAMTAQSEALDRAIDHGLRMAPAMLRRPLRKILFP